MVLARAQKSFLCPLAVSLLFQLRFLQLVTHWSFVQLFSFWSFSVFSALSGASKAHLVPFCRFIVFLALKKFLFVSFR